MKKYNIIFIPLLATLFVGCAVQGAAYKAETTASTKSALYLYRPYNLLGAIEEYPVNRRDSSISLGPGGDHLFALDPGHMRCSVHTEVTTAIEFDAKAGETYYTRESMVSVSNSNSGSSWGLK